MTFDGRDDLTPAEEIKKAEEMQGYEDYGDKWFDPRLNPTIISIWKEKDGNYKAWGQKNGRMIKLRSGKPEDVLSEFLTTS